MEKILSAIHGWRHCIIGNELRTYTHIPLQNRDRMQTVYFLVKNDEVIYVGATSERYNRYLAHKRKKYFDTMYYIEIRSKTNMFDVENSIINTLRPALNKLMIKI